MACAGQVGGNSTGGTEGGLGGAPGSTGGAAGQGAGGMGDMGGPMVVSPFVSVGIGAAHACAVRQDGTIKCVGSNDKGQATPPPGLLFYQVAAGAEHTCASKQDLQDRTKDRQVVCWGDNSFGQVTMPAMPVFGVVAGAHHNCGGTADNGTVCWGDNSHGQSTVPPGLLGGVGAAGRNHTCTVVAGDGGLPTRVVCWGDNSRGQLTPPPFNQSDPIGFITAGGDHTCVSALGHLDCWGDNEHEQSSPLPPSDPWFLSAASGHTCGVDLLGGVSCWGNDWGTSLPTPPAGQFSMVFAGDFLNCAIPKDNTAPMLCWGQTYEPWY